MKRWFRLGTTSFIYPDHILPNVQRMGAVFDEIELLIFESIPDTVLPTEKEIAELAALSGELNVRYNIHLPTDVSLTSRSPQERQKAADTISKVMALCESLAPTTYTLHLEMTPAGISGNVKAWQDRAMDGLNHLVPRLPDSRILSLETLDYPPAWLLPLLAVHNVNICIDAGHHFRYHYDLEQSFRQFRDRLAMVHLHGVTESREKIKDHTGLDWLTQAQLHQALDQLKAYKGCVSLEVFNRDHLNRSLAVLSEFFDDIPSPLPA